MPKKKNKIFLFDPVEDQDVLRWFDSQKNATQSLRFVIHQLINEYGYTDFVNQILKNQTIFNGRVDLSVPTSPRRGRPPKQRSENFETNVIDPDELRHFNSESLALQSLQANNYHQDMQSELVQDSISKKPVIDQYDNDLAQQNGNVDPNDDLMSFSNSGNTVTQNSAESIHYVDSVKSSQINDHHQDVQSVSIQKSEPDEIVDDTEDFL